MDRFQLMRLFVRIVETGSFSAVARELDTTQPTVSKQLTALERQLGARLLNRTTRGLSPTEAGATFYDRATRILEDLQEAEASLTQLQNRATGTLRINASVAFGQIFLVPSLFEFRRKYPEIHIDLSLNDRFVDLVQEGMDLAIRLGPLEDSQLVARNLGKSARLCVASPQYLAARGTPSAPQELASHNCITYTYTTTGSEWRFQGDQGMIPVRVFGDFRTNNAFAILQAAVEGVGVANLPKFMVRGELAAGTVVPVLERYGPMSVDVHAVYPTARFESSKLKLFLEFLQQEVPNYPLG
jgi:DNA-binding transcriptional LysR family regulator